MYFVFLSQMSFALFQFFLVFFILKNEGVETLGVYGLFISVLNPLQQFFKLGIPKLIVTAFEPANQKRYYIMSFFSMIVFFLIGFIASFFFFQEKYYFLFIILLIFRALINFRECQQSLYIRNKLFKNYFKSAFICNILLILLFWLTYIVYSTLIASFFVSCCLIMIFLMIDIIKQQKIVNLKYLDLTKLRGMKEEILKMGKLSIADGIFTLKSNLPRYIIASNFNIAILGIYTAMFQAVSVLEIINQSVLKYYYSNLTEHFKKKSKEVLRIIKRVYLITTFVVVISLVLNYFIGEFLLETFFGKEFIPYLNILLILIVERYFGMLNSIPKTLFILFDKIQVNIFTTSIILIIMFFILRMITNFTWFNITIVFLTLVQFIINKMMIYNIVNTRIKQGINE